MREHCVSTNTRNYHKQGEQLTTEVLQLYLPRSDAGRVLFADEACVSSGGARRASSERANSVADKNNCSISERGKQSRLVVSKNKFDEHVTLVAGYTTKVNTHQHQQCG
jgi:hypothetical protein